MQLVELLVLGALLCGFASADCALKCEESACFTNSTTGLDCLYSVPFNASWATATIDVISQSLENFGFDALYHSTGPPYSIQLDVQGELSTAQTMVDQGDFATDLDFQEYIQNLIQVTQDAHTRYKKPKCYNAIFVQPFAFDVRVEDNSSSVDEEPKIYTMRNIFSDSNYSSVYGEIDLTGLFDQEIESINGVEVTTEISSWGDTHETRSNNRGIRFNAAVRSYLYRSSNQYSILPVNDITVRLVNGAEFILPWLVQYTSGLGEVSVCAAEPSTDQGEQSRRLQAKKNSIHFQQDSLTSSVPYSSSKLHDSRSDREVIIAPGSEYEISCFVQTTDSADAQTAGVSKVLVMKVASFSPDATSYQVAWEGFLDEAEQCLSVDFDMIVVDVMQNGGGYVCLGLRLIELLVEDYFNDHTLVQMNYDLPHSKLMDQYIAVKNAPDPYPDPDAVEQILDRSTGESFPDGQAYYYPGRNVTQGGVVSWRTNWFSLDCREAEAMPSNGFVPPKFMPPEKLVILTDGTCGSTCASFTKIPQEAGKATFVGAGGLWGESMDVSSFAGGFVCNPSYLTNIANWSLTTFPQFLTDQSWQFGWAAWYSAKQPTRPVQFTTQDPDYREAFWGFPHVSINAEVTTEMVSSLYDRVISSTLSRLAAESPVSTSSDDCSDRFSAGAGTALVSMTAIFAALLLILGSMYWFQCNPAVRKRSKSYASDGDEETVDKDLVKTLIEDP